MSSSNGASASKIDPEWQLAVTSAAPAAPPTTSMSAPSAVGEASVPVGQSNIVITPLSVASAGPKTAGPGAVPSSVPSDPARLASANGKAAVTGRKRSIDSLPPLDRSGRNLSEKKIRRLEKNRLSARECRRKKKEAAQSLQAEINVLEADNLRLRLQLQIGEKAEESTWQDQAKLTEVLDNLLKSGACDSQIYDSIEEFKEKYTDYGRDRRSAIEFHLRNIERLLLPTTTTSVAMRALHGGPATEGGIGSPARPPSESRIDTGTNISGDTSASTVPEATIITPAVSAEVSASSSIASKMGMSPASETSTPASLEPKPMFHYLVKYLGVTPAQAAALKDSRFIAKELDTALKESLSVAGELRERLTRVGEDLEAEMDGVRAILTPKQAAKFLVWVSNNGAAMHMLDELWSKNFPGDDSEDKKS